ncbi:hypothetical protein PCASD_00901 [Puccinia coronata f. sp. avenae]|uniref:Uncharacterized protein n=1 Tax=Puccinia coronata f. sp. avenae TaxID=200324 RepID=A0A2N5VPH1_9BASI|nr:hypothetical protein PCASD_00901 [Puccinia coronata f. sp. avenae]
MHLVVPGTSPLEAFPEKIQRVTEERIEFPVNKVEKWYPDTVKLVVEGKGSTIQREEAILEKLKALNDPGNHMKFKLGWTKAIDPQVLPPYLSQRDYENPELVKFTRNDFPWDMAKDVEHHVMWIRPQLVTPAAFKRREDDPPYPSREYRKINGLRVAALVEYLNKNNMYGWTGLPPSAVSPFRQSILLHPTKKHVWKSESGELITRQEATRAMRWVARHTESLIEMKFPPSSYETVWSRSSKRVQSFNDPNHLHVLVIPKSSPHSFSNRKSS